jgi:hypothetical protein
MNTIILPGNSPSNEEWGDRLKAKLANFFNLTYLARYEHWRSGVSLIDLDRELERLYNKNEPGLEIPPPPYVIVAKSAGVLLSAKGVFLGHLNPIRCVFIGTAIHWGESIGWPVRQWFSRWSIPTLFIQNQRDPAISTKDLQRFITEIGGRQWLLEELVGDSHDYPDIQLLSNLIKDFTFNN